MLTMGRLISLLYVLINIFTVNALSCFKCSSRNHDNPGCDDTFMNPDGANSAYLESDCWAPRTGRTGLFPATQCIKVVVDDEDNGNHVIVRDCVVDNGDMKSETEIGRLSHCSAMGTRLEFNDVRSSGCIEVCDTDACNTGKIPEILYSVLITLLVITQLTINYL
ncbi:uncharacterized protein LOC127733457 [Mytilus californianus]|uniref:uncharacterized protein LOC127733457 n=1 Tax=Mytilus californianus TaxID=6549 RepID=UPI002246A3E9|nr:uncharacterized protein LOC127733457 [Mytilus californianus]